MRPTLEFVASASVDLGAPLEIGQTPTGRKRVIPIAGGSLIGKRISAEILAGGADWQTVLEDGTAIIDARYTLCLADGHLASVVTTGVRSGERCVLEALTSGDEVPPDRYYFRFTASFVTAAEGYTWLTNRILVGSGMRSADRVRYDLYRVT